MTQSPKPKKPRPREKLSDKEQSERFRIAALELGAVLNEDGFDQVVSRVASQKPKES